MDRRILILLLICSFLAATTLTVEYVEREKEKIKEKFFHLPSKEKPEGKREPPAVTPSSGQTALNERIIPFNSMGEGVTPVSPLQDVGVKGLGRPGAVAPEEKPFYGRENISGRDLEKMVPAERKEARPKQVPDSGDISEKERGIISPREGESEITGEMLRTAPEENAADKERVTEEQEGSERDRAREEEDEGTVGMVTGEGKKVLLENRDRGGGEAKEEIEEQGGKEEELANKRNSKHKEVEEEKEGMEEDVGGGEEEGDIETREESGGEEEGVIDKGKHPEEGKGLSEQEGEFLAEEVLSE